MRVSLCVAILTAAILMGRPAEAADCAPLKGPVLNIPQPTNPFGVLGAPDSCTFFVARVVEAEPGSGSVVVYHRDGTQVTQIGEAQLHNKPSNLALTRDGKMLIAADTDDVAFIDVEKLLAGGTDAVLGYVNLVGSAAIGVLVSPDDKTLYVAGERSNAIAVIDLDTVRAGDFSAKAVVGSVAVGGSPAGLSISPDGATLYSTSQIAPAGLKWPIACPRSFLRQGPPVNPQGAVIAIDTALARSDPAHAVLSTVVSGCYPVRVVTSPSGDKLYVSVRTNNEVWVFDAAKVKSDPDNALLAKLTAGPAPVGLALNADGSRLYVANSDRLMPKTVLPQTVYDFDTGSADAPLLGKVTVGEFPREVAVTSDGAVLVSNYQSNSVDMIPSDPPPFDP